MTESTEKEMKFIEGVDLDEKNVSVEYELSEDVSVLYDKSTKKFTIEGIDQETYDEYTIDIEEPFEGLQIDKDTYLSKEDFEEFKNIAIN